MCVPNAFSWLQVSYRLWARCSFFLLLFCRSCCFAFAGIGAPGGEARAMECGDSADPGNRSFADLSWGSLSVGRAGRICGGNRVGGHDEIRERAASQERGTGVEGGVRRDAFATEA